MKTKTDKRVKYPLLKDLEIGQSFEIKCYAVDADKFVKRLRSIAQMHKKRKNLKYSYSVSKTEKGVMLKRTK